MNKHRLFCALLAIALLPACQQREKMPDFEILLKDSTTVLHTRDIPAGKPTLVFYFSPDCEHCQQETSEILQKIDSLKGMQLYFITSDGMDRLRVYDHHYKMNRYPFITLGKDVKNVFPYHYKVLSPPASAIYNKRKELVALYSGETKVSDILMHVKL